MLGQGRRWGQCDDAGRVSRPCPGDRSNFWDVFRSWGFQPQLAEQGFHDERFRRPAEYRATELPGGTDDCHIPVIVGGMLRKSLTPKRGISDEVLTWLHSASSAGS